MAEKPGIGTPILGPLTNWSASDMLKAFLSESLTPLTSSKGGVELLLRGTAGALTEQQREIIEQVKANIDYILAVRQELLEEGKKRADTR